MIACVVMPSGLLEGLGVVMVAAKVGETAEFVKKRYWLMESWGGALFLYECAVSGMYYNVGTGGMEFQEVVEVLTRR